jgi:hypothetical protein
MSPNDFVIGEIICALPRPFGKALAGTAPRRYIPIRHLSMNLKEKANAVVTRVDWPCIKYSTPYSPSQQRCVQSLCSSTGRSAIANLGDKQAGGRSVMERRGKRFCDPVNGGPRLSFTGGRSH